MPIEDAWGDAWGAANASAPANVCGTGSWNGPKPGDPDNNVLLSAIPAFGGIDLSWTFPATNPHAVAHVLIFRGQTNSYAAATHVGIAAGDYYFDKTPTVTPVRQYFWIQVVTVNGTIGSPIGPASAIARSRIDQTIEDLTGQISEGLLSVTLKGKITNIETVGSLLSAEIQKRIADNYALADAINGVAGDATAALTLVQSEVIQRKEKDSALVDQLNVLAATLNKNYAAYLEQVTLQTTLEKATADKISLLTTKFNQNSADILNESRARADADSAAAGHIQTISSTVYGNNATGQVGLTTWVQTADGKLTDIGALYTAKVSVNGLVGGFGIYNNGATVEAGFDVDRFWIGKGDTPKSTASYPFIIDNNIVYIKEAAIQKLTFSKLRADDGSFIVEGGKVKADYLSVKQITGGAFTEYNWPAGGQTGFYLGPGGLGLGNPNSPSGGYFNIRDNGDVYAPKFSIVNGKMTIDQLDVISTINIRNNAISYAGSTKGSGSNTSIPIKGHGGRCIVTAKCVLNTNGNVSMALLVNGAVLDSAFIGGGGNAIAGTATCSGTFDTVDKQDYVISMVISHGSGSFYNPNATQSSLTYLEVLK